MGRLKLAVAVLASMAALRVARGSAARRQRLRAGGLAELDGPEACRDRLQRIERVAGIGEFVWDVDTNALWCSGHCHRLLGRAPGDALTIDEVFGAIHPDDAAGAVRATGLLLAGAQPPEAELRIIRGDGEVRHVLSTAQVHRIGGRRHVVGFVKDVTDLARVRARLVQAEAQYRYLFEHNPVPMWVYDRERLTFLAVNDAMLAHYGHTPGALIGRPLDRIRPARRRGRDGAAHAARQPSGAVVTHAHADGRRMRMAQYVRDIDFAGRPARIVAVQDVTERERNEARFRLIARATSDAVYDFDVGRGSVWWSESFYSLFAHTADTVAPTFDGWVELLHPDDAGRVVADFDRALASAAGEWNIDYRLRRGDGEYAFVTERGLIERDAHGHATRVVGGLIDASAARAHEADLRLLRRAVEAAENGIVIADSTAPDQPIVYANRAFTEMTGYSIEEIRGTNARVLQREDRDQAGVLAIREALREQREVRALLRNYRKDGKLFWNEMYIAPVRDDAGALTHFVGVLNDVSERHRFEERLAHRATHDELTGLPNRVLLDDRLEQAIHAADRENASVSVVFIDLDDFKVVNDSLGHGTGDTLLRDVAMRLQEAVRETDTVSRFGGDEFVALLAGDGPEPPLDVLERIARLLAQPLALGDVQHILTASIGYCTYPKDGRDPETLLRRADLAMYEAKRAGRNRAIAYDPAFDTSASRRLKLLAQLRDALERDEFVLAFQPQVGLDGRVRALEALVRWQHPTRGLLAPGEFIGACEDSGLIVELGHCVLRAAARYHRKLASVGRGDVRIAVNVSAAQFTEDLYGAIEETMRESRLPRGALELELTESVIMGAPERAAALMARVASLGVCFAVDDFGTGYSSLAYLKRFPIDRLKIDRSFVHDLGRDDNDEAICQSIISLAHALDIGTVAEGVETELQRDWLYERGCDELQGFLVGRPQPFEALLPQLRRAAA